MGFPCEVLRPHMGIRYPISDTERDFGGGSEGRSPSVRRLCRAGDESPVPLEQAIERRMGELNTKRKIRDNQVRAMGFIVSSNDALDEKDAREFLDRSLRESEERLDGLRWQLKTSPESSRREVRG